MAKRKIIVQGTEINLLNIQEGDYVSLTDMARKFNDVPGDVIKAWMRNASNVEFLGHWEMLHNESFKTVEYNRFKNASGTNSFFLTVKEWVGKTQAIGIHAKAGRYGGTYAHKDIAVQFATWISPTFYLYVVKEFQRLKEAEAERNNLEWNVRRIMSKANYRIHTEAVRKHLIPPKIKRTKLEGMYFATEADILNVALFGMTAKQWRKENPDKKGNIRDHATTEQLLVLSNLQSLNAKLMKWDCDGQQRLQILNESAIEEMGILLSTSSLKKLPGGEKKGLKGK